MFSPKRLCMDLNHPVQLPYQPQQTPTLQLRDAYPAEPFLAFHGTHSSHVPSPSSLQEHMISSWFVLGLPCLLAAPYTPAAPVQAPSPYLFDPMMTYAQAYPQNHPMNPVDLARYRNYWDTPRHFFGH